MAQRSQLGLNSVSTRGAEQTMSEACKRRHVHDDPGLTTAVLQELSQDRVVNTGFRRLSRLDVQR